MGFVFGVLALAAGPHEAAAQGLTYTSGQSLSPAFEGWEVNPDGSFNLLFGYMNRNWEEEPNVQIGDDNHFSPGPDDRGQPTHFLPRRNRFVFKVQVPADFGEQELAWTVRVNGVEKAAYGSLKPDYFVDNMVIMSETGTLGPGSSNPELRAHTPPVVELEMESVIDARVGQPVTLTAHVTDDGLPRRSRKPPARHGRGHAESGPRAGRSHANHRAKGSGPSFDLARLSCTWGRRGEFRPGADLHLGGHAPLFQLSVVPFLGTARVAGGRALGDGGDLSRARHLRAPGPGRRRRTVYRQTGHRPGQSPGVMSGLSTAAGAA